MKAKGHLSSSVPLWYKLRRPLEAAERAVGKRVWILYPTNARAHPRSARMWATDCPMGCCEPKREGGET